MTRIVARPDRFFHRSIHADIGYVVLLLVASRLIWLGFSPRPARPAEYAALGADPGPGSIRPGFTW